MKKKEEEKKRTSEKIDKRLLN